MVKRLQVIALICLISASMSVFLSGCSSQKTYVPESKSPVLSTPAIGESGKLRVGVDAAGSLKPLAQVEASKIEGLDVDIVAALADELGLKLDIIDVGSDPAGALAEGKVDIVLGVSNSNSDATIWKSDPYLPTGVALFSLNAAAPVPTEASGATFAAQVSSTSAWSVMNEFGDKTLTPTSNLEEAFSALSSGAVQYVAADPLLGTYAAYRYKVNASIVAFSQQPGGYCIGVLDSNKDLRDAVANALSSLKNTGIISIIEIKWLGTSLDVSQTPLTAGATAQATMMANVTAAATTPQASANTAPGATGAGAQAEAGQAQ